ncbi:MAG: zinc ribbon domain-containing protein [bacterium]|nr:zinc ribbon domain-containing protein [bacterium]
MNREEEINQSSPPPSLVCGKCNNAVEEYQDFCTHCGEPLKEGVKKSDGGSADSLLNSAEKEGHDKKIRESRFAIMAVTIIIIFFATYMWHTLEMDIKQIEADPMMEVDREVVKTDRLEIGLTFLVGFIYLSLYFWAKKNPFAASLTALLIYLTNLIVSVGINPANLGRGIFINILIIAALTKGVKSGLAYKRNIESPG